jgi:hypothetical protein
MTVREIAARVMTPVVRSQLFSAPHIHVSLVLFLSLALNACASADQTSLTAGGTDPCAYAAIGNKNSRVIANPSSFANLLENIDAALVNGLFLCSEFYEDQRLRAFSAAPNVRWVINSHETKDVHLRGMSYIDKPDSLEPLLAVSREVVARPDQLSVASKIVATFSVICKCASRIEDIERTFGIYPRTVAEDQRLAGTHYARPPAPTAPFGNKVVTYHIETRGPFTSTFSVRFDSRGYVVSIAAIQRET